MIKSIFGLNTQDIMQKRAEDIRQRALQRTRMGDIDPTVAILGESLGNVLGRGLLSKLGYEDPELAQAKEAEALQEQFTAIDKSTPQGNYQAAQILDKAGRPELAVQYRNAALRMLEQQQKKNKVGEVVSSIPLDPKDMEGSLTKQYNEFVNLGMNKEANEIAKQINNLKELPVFLEKEIGNLTNKAFKNTETSNKMESLALQFEKEDPAGGIVRNTKEYIKSITGSEDEVTEALTLFNKVKADATLDNLPPGAASDKDVELVLQGFLKPSANAQTIARFLRGLAKVGRIQAAKDNFRVNYISKNKTQANVINAWNDYQKSNDFKEQMKKFGIITEDTTIKTGKNYKIVNGKLVEIKEGE